MPTLNTNTQELSFKDLILDEQMITEGVTPIKRKRNVAQYNVVLASDPDFVIERILSGKKKQLVILISQKQYYIKNVDNGAIEVLTPKNLSSFLRDANDLDPQVSWLGKMNPGINLSKSFISLIENDIFVDYAKHGDVRMRYGAGGNQDCNWRIAAIEKNDVMNAILKTMYSCVPKDIIRKAIAKAMTLELPLSSDEPIVKKLCGVIRERTNAKYCMDNISVDGFKRYLKEYIINPALEGGAFPINYREYGFFDEVKFDIDSFIEYAIYERIRQGEALNYAHFFNVWGDVLRMQRQLRGKIWDKYPKNLNSLHAILSYKCMIMEQELDEERFKKNAEIMRKYNWEDGKYIIISPENKQDMLDEATQQANCLASYTKAVASCETQIYFLRTKKEPEKSLVTFEIRNGELRQAFRASNKTPSDKEMDIIYNWCDEFGFKHDKNSNVPLAV